MDSSRGPLREHQAGHEVAERVLLPVDEMVGRLDRQRVRVDLGPGMRCRTEPNDVRVDGHKTVEAICRAVLQSHLDPHADPFTNIIGQPARRASTVTAALPAAFRFDTL